MRSHFNGVRDLLLRWYKNEISKESLQLLLLALQYDWNDANPKESLLNSQMLLLCIHCTHAELALNIPSLSFFGV